MRYLLILLVSFNASANFIKKSDVGSCEATTIYVKESICGDECIKINKNYNCRYSEVKPSRNNKTQVQSCLSSEDCQSRFDSLICIEGSPLMNLDSLEVYCNEFIQERIGNNQNLKDAYEAEIAAIEQEKSDRKAEIALIKATKDDINNSDLPPWHKKILRRLIKELRE